MKKTIRTLLIGCVLLLSLPGCANDNSSKESDAIITTESTSTEYPEKTEEITIESVVEEKLPLPFEFILNNIYDSLQLEPATEENSCVHFSMGIQETVLSGENAEERMKAIAYCVRDVNEDGVNELLILDATYPESGSVRILDMYTLVEGTPVRVIEGWARNRYYLLDDGIIYRSASGGALYSNEELLSFEAGTYELAPKELYFTYPKNDDGNDCGFYYSADGVYDVSVATEITEEDFRAFYNDCESKIVTFDAKTFDFFKLSE